MPLRLNAADLGYGMLLTGIAAQADAEQLQAYFHDNGLTSRIEPQTDGKYQMLIHGVSHNAFSWLIAGADVELI